MFAVNGFVVGTWIASIPGVQVSLAASATEIGIALLFTAAGSLVAMPITGQLLAHVPSRRLLIVTSLTLPFLAPLPVLAPSVPLLAVALFVFGALNGAMDVSMNAHGVTLERSLGKPITSSLHAGWSIGGLVGAAAVALAVALVDPPAGRGSSRPRPRSGSSRSSPVGSSGRARSRRRARAASAFRRARSCRSACWRSEPRSPKAAWPIGPASTCARASARTPPSRPSATPRSRWAWRSDVASVTACANGSGPFG